MEDLKYKIRSENGIHARPAGYLADLAKRFGDDVSITIKTSADKNKTCDAKSILSIMKLGLKQNDEVVFTLNGPAEKVIQVKNELDSLFNTDELKINSTTPGDHKLSFDI